MGTGIKCYVRPSPPPAPVTSATRPSKRIVDIFLKLETISI